MQELRCQKMEPNLEPEPGSTCESATPENGSTGGKDTDLVPPLCLRLTGPISGAVGVAPM